MMMINILIICHGTWLDGHLVVLFALSKTIIIIKIIFEYFSPTADMLTFFEIACLFLGHPNM